MTQKRVLHCAQPEHSASIQNLDEWLLNVCLIAYQAGEIISEYYHGSADLDIEQKKDGTPVTAADQAADDFISAKLKALTPHIDLVTEESVAQVPFEMRKDWSTFWLVDPMDGTKEFIDRTGEFSVNIALVDKHQPILGVVYAPETGDLYAACDSEKGRARKINLANSQVPTLAMIGALLKDAPMIQVATVAASDECVNVAVSRRHGGRVADYIARIDKESQTVKMGSALKACLVAEGKAHVYPRLGPTSLWDTAASQMIVESAGGAMLNGAGHPLQYVQTQSLLNPHFLVIGDTNYEWPMIPEVM